MAKSKLPSVDDVETVAETIESHEPVLVEHAGPVVTDQEGSGYISRHMVDISKRADTKLTTAQALALRNKIRQLQDRSATLNDGSRVETKSDAIRWMIEQPLYTSVR